MKKNFKKLASAALSLAMAVSCLPLTFAAETTAPTPKIHYDFTGMTKSETATEILTNKINSSTYPLRVEAGPEQKSRIAKISDDIYAANKGMIEYDARSYMRMVTDSSTASDYADTDTVFDGAFTFETWLWLKDSTSLTAEGSTEGSLVSVTGSGTYNLKINLLPDTEANKAYFYFDRTFESGSGVKMTSPACVEYGKWNHIVVSFDDASGLNKPMISLNGEDISSTLVQSGNVPAETEKGRTGANYNMATKIGQNINTTSMYGIHYAKWADIKIYDTNLTALQAYNEYAASVADFEKYYNLKIKDISGNVVSGDSLKTMEELGNTIEFTANAGDKYTADNFVLYDATDDKALALEMNVDGNTATFSGFKLTKDHNYKLYVKPVKDANGKVYRTTDEVIEFTCTQSDEPPTPIINYDFAGLTKSETTTELVKANKINSETYPLRIEAGGGQKSRIIKVSDNDYATDMSAIEFDARSYMRMVTDSSTVDNYTDIDEVFDGKFTFETWLWLKDSTSLTAESSTEGSLVSVTGSETYNLKINLIPDTEANKAYFYFDRTFESGSGVKMTSPACVEYGKWNHIVVSFDDASGSNKPMISLNGEDISGTLAYLQGANIPAESDKGRSGANYTMATKIGQNIDTTSQYGIHFAKWANIKIYDENLTAKQAKALYVNYAAPSAVPTAYASYSFNGLTKDAADKMWIKNVNAADDTKAAVFVDASADVGGGNPSWIQQTDGLNIEDTNKDHIWYKNYAYLQFKDGTSESSTASTTMMDILDGAFTFELWVNIADADSIPKNSDTVIENSPLLAYATAQHDTWNLLVWPVKNAAGDGYTLKMNRTMNPGSITAATTETIKYGEWNHILISFDATNSSNNPMIVVNGENQTLNITRSASLTADSTPRKYTAMNNPIVKVGMKETTDHALKNISVGDIKVYDSALNIKQAKNEYNAVKADYTVANDVEFIKNAEGEYYAKVIMKDTLSAVPFAAIAVYTDGRMTDVALASNLVTGENAFTTGAVTAPEGSTVRVITMNSSSALKPLLKVAEYTIPTASEE